MMSQLTSIIGNYGITWEVQIIDIYLMIMITKKVCSQLIRKIGNSQEFLFSFSEMN